MNTAEIVELRRLESLVRSGDVEALREAIQNTFVPLDVCVDTGVGVISPLLHTAAIAGDAEVCKILLRAGARIQARNEAGRTALSEAVRCRTKSLLKVAEVLVDILEVEDRMGITPLMQASVGAGVTASKKGNLELVRKLLELGADPERCDNRGLTALGHAMEDNSRSKSSANDAVVEFLKEQMVHRKALALFRQNYRVSFDENGVMHVVEK